MKPLLITIILLFSIKAKGQSELVFTFKAYKIDVIKDNEQTGQPEKVYSDVCNKLVFWSVSSVKIVDVNEGSETIYYLTGKGEGSREKSGQETVLYNAYTKSGEGLILVLSGYKNETNMLCIAMKSENPIMFCYDLKLEK